MALLAQLAEIVSDLRNETTATEALGILLRDPVAAAALGAAVRVGAPALPNQLTFTTQVADADGRPDLIGRDSHRQVLLIEGKFWFGFTEAQSGGAYLRRLAQQHQLHAPHHAHVGTLLFVVPPRRIQEVWGKLSDFYELTAQDTPPSGNWRFATAPNAVVVGLTDWPSVLEQIAATGVPSLVDDCNQLRSLVDAVDERAFVPWSVEQVTDLDTPKRLLQLTTLVESVRLAAIRRHVAEPVVGGRRITITRGQLMFGQTLSLGGVYTVLSVGLYHWSRYGQSPLWLRFGPGGKPRARAAFGNDCQETRDGVAVPVPFPANMIEEQCVDAIVDWLRSAGERLVQATEQTGSTGATAAAAADVLEDDAQLLP
jgi:hypothetical protein